jgi:hypothetical protein
MLNDGNQSLPFCKSGVRILQTRFLISQTSGSLAFRGSENLEEIRSIYGGFMESENFDATMRHPRGLSSL